MARFSPLVRRKKPSRVGVAPVSSGVDDCVKKCGADWLGKKEMLDARYELSLLQFDEVHSQGLFQHAYELGLKRLYECMADCKKDSEPDPEPDSDPDRQVRRRTTFFPPVSKNPRPIPPTVPSVPVGGVLT